MMRSFHQTRTLSHALLFGLTLVFAACDGSNDTQDGGETSGSGSTTGTESGGGGAPTSSVSSGSGTGDGGGTSGPRVSGQAVLSATPDEYWRFDATYTRIVGEVIHAEVGPCKLTEYPTTDGLFDPPGPNVGTIVVDYGAAEPLTLPPPAPYVFAQNEPAPFDAGSAISIDVEGGNGIDAQHADLVFPEGIVVTAPDLEGLVVDRAQDLQVTWTGGTSEVNVVLTTDETLHDDVYHSVVIECAFDAASGGGTVPSAALQRLLPGMGAIVINVTDSVDIVQSESISTRLEAMRIGEDTAGNKTSLTHITLE